MYMRHAARMQWESTTDEIIKCALGPGFACLDHLDVALDRLGSSLGSNEQPFCCVGIGLHKATLVYVQARNQL